MELPEKMLEYFGVQLSSCEVAFCVPPGKTRLARALANETGAFLTMCNDHEIMGMNKQEDTLASKFEEAQDYAPFILVIDEITSLTPRREGITSEAKRMVSCRSLQLDALICTNLPDIGIDSLLDDVKMKLQKLDHQ